MTAPTQDPRALIERARELDRNATPGPWLIEREEDPYAEEPEDGELAALEHPNYIGPLHVPEHKNDHDIPKRVALVEADYAFVAESRTLLPALAQVAEDALVRAEKAEAAARQTIADFHEFRRRLLKILKPEAGDQGLLDIELAQIRMQDLAATKAELVVAWGSPSEAHQEAARLRARVGELEGALTDLAHGKTAARCSGPCELPGKCLACRANGNMKFWHNSGDAAIEERDTALAQIESAKSKAEEIESMLGDAGLMLCEHFGDRTYWERSEIPAGIELLIGQIQEADKELESAKAHPRCHACKADFETEAQTVEHMAGCEKHPIGKIVAMIKIWADGGDGLSSRMIMGNIAMLLGVSVHE